MASSYCRQIQAGGREASKEVLLDGSSSSRLLRLAASPVFCCVLMLARLPPATSRSKSLGEKRVVYGQGYFRSVCIRPAADGWNFAASMPCHACVCACSSSISRCSLSSSSRIGQTTAAVHTSSSAPPYSEPSFPTFLPSTTLLPRYSFSTLLATPRFHPRHSRRYCPFSKKTSAREFVFTDRRSYCRPLHFAFVPGRLLVYTPYSPPPEPTPQLPKAALASLIIPTSH